MADYPSNAPLPKIRITSVKGKSTGDVGSAVSAIIEGYITNFQEVKDWLVGQGFPLTTWYSLPGVDTLLFITDKWNYAIYTENGTIVTDLGGSGLQPFDSNELGKWNTRSLLGIWDLTDPQTQHLEYEFNPPLYLYEVYVPSNLPRDVWTDLQFKQRNGTGLAIIVPLALLFIFMLFLALSGGKKRRHR